MRLPIRNTADRWGVVTIGIHWLTVLAVAGLCIVGFLMQELPRSIRPEVYSLHRSLGLTVLALTLLRLLWRLAAGAPAPEPGIPRWQARVAGASHGLLYAVLLAMPLAGWLNASASGDTVHWFGQFALPGLARRDHDLAEFAEEAHEVLFLVLAALVTVHALAALKHHHFNRDRTLHRMLPLVPPPDAPVAPSPPPSSGVSG